jgi:tRNA G37 N-methylase TrmD
MRAKITQKGASDHYLLDFAATRHVGVGDSVLLNGGGPTMVMVDINRNIGVVTQKGTLPFNPFR